MVFSEVPNFSEPNQEVLAKIHQINHTHVSTDAQREKRCETQSLSVCVCFCGEQVKSEAQGGTPNIQYSGTPSGPPGFIFEILNISIPFKTC